MESKNYWIVPLIKEEVDSDFEYVPDAEVEVDEEDPEGTSIVISDVSIHFSGIKSGI